MIRVRTLAGQLRQHAVTQGEAPAFLGASGVISYEELDRLTSRVSNALINSGASRGKRFAFLARNRPEIFELIYGAAKAGAVPVGINWRLTPGEAAYILQDSDSIILFTDEETFELASRAADLAGSVEKLVVIGGRTDGPGTVYEEWRDQHPPTDPMLDQADAIAIQLYTSGTTGQPKGALLSHENLLAQGEAERACGAWFRPHAEDAVLVAMPLYHVGGMMMGLTGLAEGAALVVTSDASATNIIALTEEHRVTYTFLVPTVVQSVLDHSECLPDRLKTWRMLRYGAAPMPAAQMRQIRKILSCHLAQVYGMTEVGGAATLLPPMDHVDAEVDRRLRSVGKALPGMDIEIRNAEGGLVEVGQIAEICIRSPSVMQGYWNQSDATREAFHGDWYRSGDAGWTDADGYIYLADRIKEVIISGGENIYPAEVESALGEHPAVREAAAVGVPDDRWGEVVKAFVAMNPGMSVGHEELISFVRSRIAAFKVPKTIEYLPSLPRNPSGKIERRKLRAPFWTTSPE